jgi:hypothetical protein
VIIISNSKNGEILASSVLAPEQKQFKYIAGGGTVGPEPTEHHVPPGTYYVRFFVTNVTGRHDWPAGFIVAQTGGVASYATVTLTEEDVIVLS